MSQSESKSKLEKSHPDSVLPKIEEINFETISMIFKDTIRLSMSDVNNEIQKGFAGRNDSSLAKVGCAFQMVQISSKVRMGHCSDDDHRDEAPHRAFFGNISRFYLI